MAVESLDGNFRRPFLVPVSKCLSYEQRFTVFTDSQPVARLLRLADDDLKCAISFNRQGVAVEEACFYLCVISA